MSRKRLRPVAPCVVALLASACGGVTTSAPTTTTTRPGSGAPLTRVVTAGRLAFELPASWTVGYGACRCSWGQPDTATLDNGSEEGGVACNCPMESTTAPSGLHLYEGQGGLVPSGDPTTVDGTRALVALDPAKAALTVTVPGVDQWLTIGPGPMSSTATTTSAQVAVEKEILATISVTPAGGGTP